VAFNFNNVSNPNIFEALATLFLSGKRGYYFESGFLPVEAINVFLQPRKTFEGIHELGLDMAVHGQLHPITIAPFSKEDCEGYLWFLKLIWVESPFTIDDARPYVQNGKEVYETLIAGERRVRAWLHRRKKEFDACPICQELWEVGCEDCRRRYGQEPPGTCYKRHFGGPPVEEVEPIEVKLCVGINPLQAFFLQLSENTHMPVPSHEEARAYANFYKVIREAAEQQNERMSPTGFAHLVGRRPDYIRRAIRFCELPYSIQEMVEQRIITFGIALELARLQDNGLSETELDWWFKEAVTQNYKTEEFRNIVSSFIWNLASGQTSLFDIFSEEQRREMEKPHFRLVVERHTIMAVWTWIHYVERLQDLFNRGKLGKEDSPFSIRSPVKVSRALVEKLKQVLPCLEGHIPKKKYAEAEAVIKKAEKLLAIREKEVPK